MGLSTDAHGCDAESGVAHIVTGVAQLRSALPVLVVAGPGETQDAILAAVAAQELDAEIVTDPERVGSSWRGAATVLIAEDLAPEMAARALPQREAVYLVGCRPDALSMWSAPLAARVITLPEGAAWLGAVLGEGRSRTRAPVVAIMGGSGGVGASTLAAAIAQLSASGRGHPAALVDADPLGGGIDLLLGAEGVSGWRWPHLNGAAGQLGDLRGYLPVVEKVSVVSMARENRMNLAREPLAAIVNSLAIWHSLVVIDPGRTSDVMAREALRQASRHLVVVSATVRGVAAARELLADPALAEAELVVRRSRGALAPAVVSDVLDRPLRAVLPTDSALAPAAERGEPPARAAGRAFRREASRLVDQLLPPVTVP